MNRNQKSLPVLGRKKTLAIIGAGIIVALALLGCPTDPGYDGLVPQELLGEWVYTDTTGGTVVHTLTFSKNEVKHDTSTGGFMVSEPTSFTPKTNDDKTYQTAFPSGYNYVGVFSDCSQPALIGAPQNYDFFVAPDGQSLLWWDNYMVLTKKP